MRLADWPKQNRRRLSDRRTKRRERLVERDRVVGEGCLVVGWASEDHAEIARRRRTACSRTPCGERLLAREEREVALNVRWALDPIDDERRLRCRSSPAILVHPLRRSERHDRRRDGRAGPALVSYSKRSQIRRCGQRARTGPCGATSRCAFATATRAARLARWASPEWVRGQAVIVAERAWRGGLPVFGPCCCAVFSSSSRPSRRGFANPEVVRRVPMGCRLWGGPRVVG